MQPLKKTIADIIYEGDWEIRDRDDFYLIDEEAVIDKIINVVREADLWPHPFWRK